MILKKILLLVFVFLYVYGVSLKLIPYTFSLILGILGYATMFFYIKTTKRAIYTSKKYLKKLLPIMLLIIGIDVLTSFCNGVYQFRFVRNILLDFMFIGAGFLLFYLFRKVYKTVTLDLLIKYYMYAAIVQLSVSILMYFDPALWNFVNTTLFETDERTELLLEANGMYRLMGFGTKFFGSAVVHGFIMVLMSYFFLKGRSVKQSTWLILALVFIATLSAMMARTSMVGLLIFFVIVFYKRFFSFYMLKTIFGSILLVAFSASVLLAIWPDLIENMDTLLRFGFEMFYSYFESGEMSAHSVDLMEKMYIFPDSVTTWFLGDAIWTTNGFYYYMGTDIGLCRMIFYFGLTGTLCFYFFQYKIGAVLNKKFPKVPSIFFWGMSAFAVALSLKGYVDIFYLWLPFFFCTNESFKEVKRSKLLAKSDVEENKTNQ